jgi:hypothetical protein
MRSITQLAQRDLYSLGGGGGLSLGGVTLPAYRPGAGFSGSGTQADPYNLNEVEVKAKSGASGNALDSLFANFGQVGAGIGNIIAGAKGQPTYMPTDYSGQGASAQPRGVSPWLYVGGGVLLLLIFFMLFKKKA